ncbi:MAG: nucleoside deaminase [Fibromonadales bacterium]|nr:nucleoside deaminase [Fibromonadales bacterium]
MDEKWMRMALELAEEAADNGEVPIGAVIVLDGKLIAAAKNRMEELQCATAHAEILAINEASKAIKNWRLDGATLYVSLEPCQMCWGAIKNSRISKVIFAANADLNICSGLLAAESTAILQKFFRKVRKKKNDSGVKE